MAKKTKSAWEISCAGLARLKKKELADGRIDRWTSMTKTDWLEYGLRIGWYKGWDAAMRFAKKKAAKTAKKGKKATHDRA